MKKSYLENSPVFKEFEKKAKKQSDFELWAFAQSLMVTVHTDGFNLGVTHGKMLGSQIEKSLMINQGQLNGVKHGWINGFEQGQISGIK